MEPQKRARAAARDHLKPFHQLVTKFLFRASGRDSGPKPARARPAPRRRETGKDRGLDPILPSNRVGGRLRRRLSARCRPG